MATVGGTLQLISELAYSVISKVDPSVPSYTSRIDRVLMDHRNAYKDDGGREKVAIVTGADSGVGFVTANALARAGYQTILACQDQELAQEALDHLKRQTGLDNLEVMQLDLASLASVKRFVEQFVAKYKALDVLVNNDCVAMCPYSQTKDRIEMQFGTSHIGHFALTTQLLDSLMAAEGGARVVNVSSIASVFATNIDYSAIEDKAKYSPTGNYAIAKLANITFSNALARRLEGTNVTVNSLHPGSTAPNISPTILSNAISGPIARAVIVDAHHGAFTPIYLALSPGAAEVTGKHFSRGQAVNPHPKALDKGEQERLWAYSEQLVAEKLKTL
ncbi:hypothetical protein FBU59_001652 [Linderina macrospora]|uniref:Uncharacterized protein n=1 Tax=Linderina macrospora TaxID=4868 RepID=A0ACC1JDK4_9FUNG|nr:hypothetical protein FBU59_001652 [Linderina macrospora]